MDDTYEMLRDVLRQIAVHDPDLGLAAVAEACLEDLSLMGILLAMADGSTYRRKLVSTNGALLVLEAA